MQNMRNHMNAKLGAQAEWICLCSQSPKNAGFIRTHKLDVRLPRSRATTVVKFARLAY